MLQQCHIEVGPPGVVQNVPPGVAESETSGCDKRGRIIEQRPKTGVWSILNACSRVADKVRVGASSQSTKISDLGEIVTRAGIVGRRERAIDWEAKRIEKRRPGVVNTERRATLNLSNARPLPASQEL